MDRQKASRPVAEFSAYEPRGNDQLAGQIDFQATTKEYIPQPGDCYLMQPCGRSRKPFCEFEIFERPGEGLCSRCRECGCWLPGVLKPKLTPVWP